MAICVTFWRQFPRIYFDGSTKGIERLITCLTSSKRRHKNSMKCAIAKFLNQDGRPDRYLKLKRMMKNSAKRPPTQPERERTAIEVSPKLPCCAISLRRRPSCQQNPKNGPRDEETQKFAYFACAT